jgi:hypothetical protein
MPKTAKDNAVELLQHYFEQAWTAAGLDWASPDNDGEVEAIVDALEQMAVAAAQDAARDAVEAHRENEPHLYADGSGS